MPTSAFVVMDLLPDGDPAKRVAQDYYDSYRSAYNLDPSPFGANIADAFAIAVDAIKRAGSLDKAVVRDAIENTRQLVGLNGTFTMSSTDHGGLNIDALHMVLVKDGRFVAAH